MLIYRHNIDIGKYEKNSNHKKSMDTSLFDQPHALFRALISLSLTFCDAEQRDKIHLAHINGLWFICH